MRYLCLILLIVNILIQNSQQYFTTIEAQEEECFFERSVEREKFVLTFEVIEGGTLDIDVTITGPDNHILRDGGRERMGQYEFTSYADGVYRYCFSNKISLTTQKIILFTMLKMGNMPNEAKNSSITGY